MAAFSARNALRLILLLSGVSILVLCGVLLATSSDAVAQRETYRMPDTAQKAADAHMDECTRSLREIYGRVIGPTGEDSLCSFTCRVEVDMADTINLRNSVSDVEITLGASMMEVKSSLFAVYRDSVDVFTMIPESRTIYRSDARAMAMQNPYDLAWMRDTLITRSTITACDDLSDSAHARQRRLHLIPDPAARKYFGIASMTVLLDMDRREVRSMSLEPLDKGMYTELRWTFSPYRYTQLPAEGRESMARRFLAEGNVLRHDWKGYNLVDNRTLASADSDN